MLEPDPPPVRVKRSFQPAEIFAPANCVAVLPLVAPVVLMTPVVAEAEPEAV